MSTAVATGILTSVALVVSSVVALAWQMRDSGNLPWHMRKIGIALTGTSILCFLASGALAAVWLFRNFDLPTGIGHALDLGIVGLVPFFVFLVVIYRETRHHAA